MRRGFLLGAAVAAMVAGAGVREAVAETYDAHALARMALELDAPGLKATFRNKELTVTGLFEEFVDTGYGNKVWVVFQHPENNSWKVQCAFAREDTAAYDRFALMKKGTPITATGMFADAGGVFLYIELLPCSLH